jgi:hypothetical protein
MKTNEEKTLLTELLAVLKERAVGHTIMYSDRLTPFIPRIEQCLTQAQEGRERELPKEFNERVHALAERFACWAHPICTEEQLPLRVLFIKNAQELMTAYFGAYAARPIPSPGAEGPYTDDVAIAKRVLQHLAHQRVGLSIAEWSLFCDAVNRLCAGQGAEDGRILDWLEKNFEQVCQRIVRDGFFYFDHKDQRQKHAATLRAACLAAMSAQSAQDEGRKSP